MSLRVVDVDVDLIVAGSLPLVLAVLLVVGVALGLGVVLRLLPVLGGALLLVLRAALLLVHGLALLSSGGDTLPPVGRLALRDVHSDAVLKRKYQLYH